MQGIASQRLSEKIRSTVADVVAQGGDAMFWPAITDLGSHVDA